MRQSSATPAVVSPVRRAVRGVVAACVVGVGVVSVASMPGCLVSGSSYVKNEGRYISGDTLKKIVPGETTQEWVHAVLGEPTHRTTLSDGREIWKWSSKSVNRSSGAVFLIARGSNHEVIERTVYVEFDREIVSAAWKD